jgi:hypothetical protein
VALNRFVQGLTAFKAIIQVGRRDRNDSWLGDSNQGSSASPVSDPPFHIRTMRGGNGAGTGGKRKYGGLLMEVALRGLNPSDFLPRFAPWPHFCEDCPK